jgi:hypothetical protein
MGICHSTLMLSATILKVIVIAKVVGIDSRQYRQTQVTTRMLNKQKIEHGKGGVYYKLIIIIRNLLVINTTYHCHYH